MDIEEFAKKNHCWAGNSEKPWHNVNIEMMRDLDNRIADFLDCVVDPDNEEELVSMTNKYFSTDVRKEYTVEDARSIFAYASMWRWETDWYYDDPACLSMTYDDDVDHLDAWIFVSLLSMMYHMKFYAGDEQDFQYICPDDLVYEFSRMVHFRTEE